MLSRSLLDSEPFCRLVELLHSNQDEIDIEDLCFKWSMQKSEFDELLKVFTNEGFELKLFSKNGRCLLGPISIEQKENLISIYHKQVENIQKIWEREFDNKTDEMFKLLELAIENKKTVAVRFSNNLADKILFPKKVIYYDGKLILISEICNEKCLVFHCLDSLVEVVESSQTYQTNFTLSQVDEFILNLRSMNGNESRLVLKIRDGQFEKEIFPFYHFARKPFVVKNSRGQLIWAASIEVCDEVIECLANLGDRVEVFDPIDVREEVECLKKKIKAA